MQKRIAILLILILIVCLSAWSPWITESFAKSRVETSFTKQYENVSDGCGFNCKGCGPKGAEKTWFGAVVTIEYACGLLPADLPEYHQMSKRFVSFLGTVHSLSD